MNFNILDVSCGMENIGRERTYKASLTTTAFLNLSNPVARTCFSTFSSSVKISYAHQSRREAEATDIPGCPITFSH